MKNDPESMSEALRELAAMVDAGEVTGLSVMVVTDDFLDSYHAVTDTLSQHLLVSLLHGKLTELACISMRTGDRQLTGYASAAALGLDG